MAKINDYELLQQIGSGTYSVVHKAIHKRTREFCAIKILERKKFLKINSMDRLVTEIELLKKLEHRYIVKMLDFGWDSQNIYIIMELCETSLSSFIKKRQRLAEKSCRYFLRMLAEAMAYLRENNISHFDLKPHNLLLTKDASRYILKLCDFGFASICEEEEEQGLKGSPLYMGPEIIITGKYDARADLWSIGVILYECLFGKAPYSSKSMEELFEKIRNKQHIDIPSHPKISCECEDLLTRLLQHDPENRITFQEFFNHEFIAPTDENLDKAIEIMTKAVEEDLNKKYQKAYHLYCEGLTYFVPVIDAESGSKKAALRERALSYMKRAEEIKHSILNSNYQEQTAEPQPSSSNPQPLARTVQRALEPSHHYKILYEKCYSRNELKNGLEIGQQAEYYAFERKLETALETYKRSLSILVPLLNTEQDVERKKLLHKQILDWMKDAESIKALIEAQKHIASSASSETNEMTSNTHCVIS